MNTTDTRLNFHLLLDACPTHERRSAVLKALRGMSRHDSALGGYTSLAREHDAATIAFLFGVAP